MVDISVLNIGGAETDDETRSFPTIPEGVYDFELTDSWIRTGPNAGEYLDIEMTCMDEDHMNRRVYAKFYFQSKKSAWKAKKDWVSLLEAINFTGDPENLDTEALHGSLVGVRISVQRREGFNKGNPYNQVEDFQVSAKANVSAPQPAPAQPSGARPWTKQ